MAIKMSHYSATDRYCCLTLDEAQVFQGVQYDLSLRQFVGNDSAEFASKAKKKHTVLATHVLCCMAKGIITKFDMPFT